MQKKKTWRSSTKKKMKKLGFNLKPHVVSSLLSGGKRSRSTSEAILSKLSFSNGGCTVSSNNRWLARFRGVDSSMERAICNSGKSQKFKIPMTFDLSLPSSRYGAQGVQNLKHALHTCSSEEDDFSELGEAMPKGGSTKLSLISEMPNVYLNGDASRRSRRAATTGIKGQSKPKSESPTSKRDKPSWVFPHLYVDETGDSGIVKGTEGTPTFDSSNSITIENIHNNVSLSQLKSAVAVFGEIAKASMVTLNGGLHSCNVEFKKEESKKRAIASRGIFLHSLHLRIRNLQVPETFVIRISNISVDTAESTIHTICMGYGSVSGLSKTKEGTVDVLFKVKDSSARENILKRLNDTSYDNSQWSAEIRQESTDSTDTVNKADVQLGAGAQLTNCLEEILMQTNVKKIYLQDLLNLQQLVRHLEENPTC